MIWHDDELVQKKVALPSIFVKRGDEQTRGVLVAEDWVSRFRRSRYEECAFGFHRG